MNYFRFCDIENNTSVKILTETTGLASLGEVTRKGSTEL